MDGSCTEHGNCRLRVRELAGRLYHSESGKSLARVWTTYAQEKMSQEHSFAVHCPPYLHHGPTHIMPQTFGILEIDERTGILVSRTLKSRRTGKQKQPPRKLYKDGLFCFNSDKNNWRSGSLRPHARQPISNDPKHSSLTDDPGYYPALSRSPSMDSFLDPALSDINSPSLPASASGSSTELDYPENTGRQAPFATKGGPTVLQPSNFLYSHVLLQPVCA